jgi:hypothetical protein
MSIGDVVSVPRLTTWHGTQEESAELIWIVASNCTCDPTRWAAGSSVCPPHRMLREDQRALDGLVFVRRIAARLAFEEHGCTGA